MWTATTQAQHSRDGLRFASDRGATATRVGDVGAVAAHTLAGWTAADLADARPHAVDVAMRDIVEAIFYVLRGGIPWRMPPTCLPPRQTVHGWFAAFRDAGVWEAVNHLLVMLDRERVGRKASPSAAVIDMPLIARGYQA